MKEKGIVLFIRSKRARDYYMCYKYSVIEFNRTVLGADTVFETNSREELRIWIDLNGYVLKNRSYPEFFERNVKNGSVSSFYLK